MNSRVRLAKQTCAMSRRGEKREITIDKGFEDVPVKIRSSAGEKSPVSLCGILVRGTIDVVASDFERKESSRVRAV